MPERFLQADAPSVINFDFKGLGDAIVQAINDHLGDLGNTVGTDLSAWLYGLMRGVLIGLWHATLLPIPHDVTDEFGPVLAMMPAPGAIAAGGITLALSLMGLRVILRAAPGYGHNQAADFLLGRLIAWGALLALLPWVIGFSIDKEQALATAIAQSGRANIDEILPQTAVANVLGLLLVIVLGLRLMVKLASNVVHIAVAIVWSPVAGVLGLIPETSHIGGLWLHEFFGRLAGAVLATIAAVLGIAIALLNGGDFATFGAAGAMVAAYDLVDWLAKTPGSSPAGVVGGMIRTAAAATGLLGSGGMGGAAMPAAEGAAALGSSGAALPASRQMAPYYSFD